jgi:hypothetical protein
MRNCGGGKYLTRVLSGSAENGQGEWRGSGRLVADRNGVCRDESVGAKSGSAEKADGYAVCARALDSASHRLFPSSRARLSAGGHSSPSVKFSIVIAVCTARTLRYCVMTTGVPGQRRIGTVFGSLLEEPKLGPFKSSPCSIGEMPKYAGAVPRFPNVLEVGSAGSPGCAGANSHGPLVWRAVTVVVVGVRNGNRQKTAKMCRTSNSLLSIAEQEARSGIIKFPFGSGNRQDRAAVACVRAKSRCRVTGVDLSLS